MGVGVGVGMREGDGDYPPMAFKGLGGGLALMRLRLAADNKLHLQRELVHLSLHDDHLRLPHDVIQAVQDLLGTLDLWGRQGTRAVGWVLGLGGGLGGGLGCGPGSGPGRWAGALGGPRRAAGQWEGQGSGRRAARGT